MEILDLWGLCCGSDAERFMCLQLQFKALPIYINSSAGGAHTLKQKKNLSPPTSTKLSKKQQKVEESNEGNISSLAGVGF